MTSELRKAAIAVRENAHAPYSKFKVGAAIRAGSGVIYVGCNVENVAYPEGTCAEAGAIAAMVAAGETELIQAYVVVDAAKSWPNLRQVMCPSPWQQRAGLSSRQPWPICCRGPLTPPI